MLRDYERFIPTSKYGSDRYNICKWLLDWLSEFKDAQGRDLSEVDLELQYLAVCVWDCTRPLRSYPIDDGPDFLDIDDEPEGSEGRPIFLGEGARLKLPEVSLRTYKDDWLYDRAKVYRWLLGQLSKEMVIYRGAKRAYGAMDTGWNRSRVVLLSKFKKMTDGVNDGKGRGEKRLEAEQEEEDKEREYGL